MQDFKPGTIIEYESRVGTIHLYTVIDPVRTPRGKLRVRGPKGGYSTFWWNPESIKHSYFIRIKKSA